MGVAWAQLGYTGVPVAAAAVAGVVVALRPPGQRLTSALQHFAAGVVFAAAAIELIPKVLEQDPAVAIIGFTAGVAVMFAIRALAERIEARAPAVPAGASVVGLLGASAGLIGATAVDFFVDGAVLGAGFTVSAETGLLLTIALAIEYLFVGLSVAAHLRSDRPWLTSVGIPVGLALLTVIAAVLGAIVLAGASSAVLAGVLAFGAVAFMYLVTEELLVKAHERGETAAGSATFFVGFLLCLVLREVLGTG